MNHDSKMQKWTASGRGQELFGQNGRKRVQENPHLRESLQRIGLVV